MFPRPVFARTVQSDPDGESERLIPIQIGCWVAVGVGVKMFSCPCLNVSIVVNDENTAAVITTNHTAAVDPGPVTLRNEPNGLPRPSPTVIAALAEGKSRELVGFFQEVRIWRKGTIGLIILFLSLASSIPFSFSPYAHSGVKTFSPKHSSSKP